jgi:hypothetical protein
MSPGEEELLIAANAAFADPAFCETVKQMHADGYPLVQMVEALGLDDEMSDRIRQILESLSPEASRESARPRWRCCVPPTASCP